MPTYEFRCTACEKVFTKIMSFAARTSEPIACPHCGSKEIEQTYTAVSVKTGKKTW